MPRRNRTIFTEPYFADHLTLNLLPVQISASLELDSENPFVRYHIHSLPRFELVPT